MVKAGTLAGVVLLAALDGLGQTAREPQTFFRNQIGLNDDQIAAIARGNPIVKVLPAKTANEIFVFGAVLGEPADRGSVFGVHFWSKRGRIGRDEGLWRLARESRKFSRIS